MYYMALEELYIQECEKRQAEIAGKKEFVNINPDKIEAVDKLAGQERGE